MDDRVEMKPCPFCSSACEERSEKGWFACSNNDCSAWHLQALAEDWNKRAEQSELTALREELAEANRHLHHWQEQSATKGRALAAASQRNMGHEAVLRISKGWMNKASSADSKHTIADIISICSSVARLIGDSLKPTESGASE